MGNAVRRAESAFDRVMERATGVPSRAGSGDGRTAAQIAEAARLAIEHDACVLANDGQELKITCSIGVATHTGGTFDCVAQLLKAADRGVYAAKAAGRNCVRTVTGESESDAA